MAGKKNNKKNDTTTQSKGASRRSTSSAEPIEENENLSMSSEENLEDEELEASKFGASDDDSDDSDDDDDDSDEDDSDETAEASGKKPHGNTGKKRAKRKIFFTCADVINNKLVVEEIFPTLGEDKFDRVAGRKEAIEKFTAKYQKEPAFISEAVYKYKGVPETQKKRDTITMTAKKPPPPFTTKRSRAIYVDSKGIEWQVVVNHTTDPSIGYVSQPRALDAEKVKAAKAQKPAPKYLRMDVFKDLKDWEEASAS